MTPWLIPFALPTYVQSFIVLVLGVPFYRRPVRRYRGFLLVTWRPWFAKRWPYVTTLGLIMGVPDVNDVSDRLIEHESIHGHIQYPDLNMLGAILAACFSPLLGWWSFLLWGTSGMPWVAPNFLTAILRYKRKGVTWLQAAYYASAHEQHAYAWTKTFFDRQLDPWEHHRNKTQNMDGQPGRWV